MVDGLEMGWAFLFCGQILTTCAVVGPKSEMVCKSRIITFAIGAACVTLGVLCLDPVTVQNWGTFFLGP